MTSSTPASRLCWIYPDRGTVRQRSAEAAAIWTTYTEIAADCGLAMSLHKSEALAVDAAGSGAPRVFLDGERITPQDTILVTSLWSLPHQVGEVCNQLFAYSIVEQAGFYLPIHPRMSYITTDKMATMLYLSDCPVQRVPTVRIGSGRDAISRHYEPALENLRYPLMVKPAYWGMGIGVCLAHNEHELRGLIGLAGGADTALVLQPYLGEGVNDFRVYVIDGKAHTVLRRIPQGASLTANLVNGGRLEYPPLPKELESSIDYLAERLRMPYFAADFLWDGDQFWLSEVEPDGAVGYALTEEIAKIQRPVIEARFRAYLAAHAEWIGRTGTPA
ncbi:RimK family alpha-L-glutamate ligase [Plantactinospora sp. GCM10030261]|uniref:ATP-grasp domain-containing protein n=1 Tax=Plantactinospora sp. GCM10030261 TaxID=3273420 RepID=UPI00360EF4AB